jgi:hypothetical protein
MTVSTPTACTLGKYAVGGEADAHYAKVTVTIKNGSAQQFDPTMAHLTASSGGAGWRPGLQRQGRRQPGHHGPGRRGRPLGYGVPGAEPQRPDD